MPNLVVVNGEAFWPDYFPDCDVYTRRLQTSRWLLHKNKLHVFNASGGLQVDAVLWRLGAIRPHPNHRAVLELVRFSGVPCVNAADVLLRGYDRLGMLNEMRAAGLPLVPMTIGVGERILESFEPELPAVLKIGNFHGGWAKARAQGRESWADLRDLSFASDDYISVEPFILYLQDVRCLAIGEQMRAMSRRGLGWKANAQTIKHELIEPPPMLADWTRQMMRHLGADLLGLDFLQAPDESWLALECNDIPGLSGFPEAVRLEVANCLRRKIG